MARWTKRRMEMLSLPWDTLVKEYLDGKTAKQLSVDMSVDDTTFRKYLKEALETRGLLDEYRSYDRCFPTGPDHYLWKGGRTVHEGYVVLLVEWLSPEEQQIAWKMCESPDSRNPRIKEHRLVVAMWLGRPLTKDETVHHKNGDTLDNSLDNLQLRDGNHNKGVVRVCEDCGSHRIGYGEIE